MDLRPRRILLITGDPPDQTDLTRPALAEGGPHDYRRAGSVAEARRQWAAERFDAVIVDDSLGAEAALDILETAVASGTPLIVTTEPGNEAGAVQAVQAGADSYLIKDPASRYRQVLPILIEQAVQRQQTAAALQAANQTLARHLAELEQRTAELAANEAKFHTLFDVLPVGVSILDEQRRVVESNRALARILKLSGQALAAGAADHRQFIHPDGAPMQPAEFPSARAVHEQRPISNVEIGVITETGETLWTDVSATPLPVAGLSAVVVTADLTERKRVEDALRDSEEKFSRAFHASAVGIIITRASDGRIVEVNDSFLRLIGYARGEVLGRTTVEIGAITPADRERFCALFRAHGHIHELEMELPTKSGDVRSVLTSVEEILIGGEPCSLSTHLDMTERKRDQEALARERDQLQALLDNIPDTIYFKDRASRFTRINRAQAHMMGLARPEVAIGKSDADFQAPHLAAKFFAEEQQLLESGRPVLDRVEFNPTPAGEARWLSATKVPLKNAAGQVVGLVGISRNVTARIQAESDLQRLNQQLADRVHELSLLNTLSERLQACLTIEETYALTAEIMGPLAPRQAGALYVVNAGRTQVTTAARWGNPAPEPQVFAPEACWALQHGQAHLLDQAHAGLPCLHWHDRVSPAALCMPLMAEGQALGTLHLRASAETDLQTFAAATQQLMRVVADSLALTWANLTLRENLRQQAIRDPLTGLFNRRYLEETLKRELRRAERNQQPVGLLMLDLDHFKQINDTFGHDAGDVILRALGNFLGTQIRGDDIACRYGGEEFLLILPQAPLSVAEARAEALRAGLLGLAFRQGGQALGPITLSIGVAAFPGHGQTAELLIHAVDQALYRAKAAGRDRVLVAE